MGFLYQPVSPKPHLLGYLLEEHILELTINLNSSAILPSHIDTRWHPLGTNTHTHIVIICSNYVITIERTTVHSRPTVDQFWSRWTIQIEYKSHDIPVNFWFLTSHEMPKISLLKSPICLLKSHDITHLCRLKPKSSRLFDLRNRPDTPPSFQLVYRVCGSSRLLRRPQFDWAFRRSRIGWHDLACEYMRVSWNGGTPKWGGGIRENSI